ncbi:MAG TPA: FAD-binding oxidoreductase [Nocardioides sp.]|nr:FAD-binding oxidoreductase [Nocardioides sp.]
MAFTGTTVTPEHADYDALRSVFNGMIDRRPSRILRCASTSDVASAVIDCRANGEDFTIYGGGHSVTGHCVADGAVCIDLRDLHAIEVDTAAVTVRVGGGATWGELDAATQEHGLAVTGGRVSGTGVGGLSLGSGSGWLERAFGFSCDSLQSAVVVTAAGDVVTASDEENPDLFWAIRGGGGNFGIVTEFTFRLHPLGPMVLGGMLLYPGFAAREVLANWRDFMATAPDEVGSGVALITAPPEEFVPEPARGQPAVGVVVCYAGEPEKGAEVCRPLLEYGPPAANLVQPMPYVAVQQLLDPGNPKGMHNYWSGDFLAELPDEAIDTYLAHAWPPVSPLTQVIVVAGGGAIARVPGDATAFGNRDAPFNTHYLGMWPPDPGQDPVNIEHIRRLATAMKPWSTGHAYLNFIGDEGLLRVEAAFEHDTYERLRRLKTQWDPDNVFRHNQNIPPAG